MGSITSYTKAALDTLLAGKSATTHDHDSRYYTESETDSLLAGKATNTHNHDDLYYTETEINSLLSGTAVAGHSHVASDISDSTAVGRSVLKAVDAAAARTAIGAGTSSLTLGTTVDKAAYGNDARFVDPQYDVNEIGSSGATRALPSNFACHRVGMSQNCTFSFDWPMKLGHTFLLHLSGAFTPTFPAGVKWNNGAAPTYTSPALYSFTTVDGGTTWIGTQIAKAIA